MPITKVPAAQILPAYRPIMWELYASSDTSLYELSLASVDVYKGLDLILEGLPFSPARQVDSFAVFTISTNANTVGTVMPPSFSPMSFIGQPYTQGSPSSANTIDFPPPGTLVANSQVLVIIKDALELNPYLDATFNFTITDTGGTFPVYTLTALAKEEGTIANFTIDLGTINSPTVRLPITLDNYGANAGYYFEVDIQGICQDTLAPFKGLPDAFSPASAGFIDNKETYDSYRIVATYYWLNKTTNLVEESTIPADLSSSVFAFACTRQHTESMFLDEFFGTIDDQNNKFLTTSPRVLDVCPTQNRWLSYIQPIVDEDSQYYNLVEVKVFGAGNLVLSEGVASTVGGGQAKQYTINTGIPALSSLFYFGTSPDFSDPSALYYTVSIGRNVNAPDPPVSYFRESEIFRYVMLQGCCSKSATLHWLNPLGAVDTYTFKTINGETLQVTNTEAQSPLSWAIGSLEPHSVEDTGAFKQTIVATESLTIESGPISSTTATFLGGLLLSLKVYLEQDGVLVPVLITNQELLTAKTGAYSVAFNLKFANNPITLAI